MGGSCEHPLAFGKGVCSMTLFNENGLSLAERIKAN